MNLSKHKIRFINSLTGENYLKQSQIAADDNNVRQP